MRKEDDAGGKFICCVMLPLRRRRRRHPRSVLNLNEGFFARGEEEEAE